MALAVLPAGAEPPGGHGWHDRILFTTRAADGVREGNRRSLLFRWALNRQNVPFDAVASGFLLEFLRNEPNAGLYQDARGSVRIRSRDVRAHKRSRRSGRDLLAIAPWENGGNG